MTCPGSFGGRAEIQTQISRARKPYPLGPLNKLSHSKKVGGEGAGLQPEAGGFPEELLRMDSRWRPSTEQLP